MSLLSWNQNSLVSDEHMLHAREGYRPTRVLPTTEMAFANWTERVAAQPALVTARELSGLSHDNLAALASEFELAPWRKRKDIFRFALPAGVALLASSGILMGLAELATGAGGFTWWDAVGGVGLVMGFALVCLGALVSFNLVAVEKAYGQVGLLVGELNEQHPWLYRTFLLMNNPAAEAYRIGALTERGVLRGVDFIMMHEIASAQETVDLTQTARWMRERVQRRA